MSARQRCERCGVNRLVKFFPRDARRTDLRSPVCTHCKRAKRRTASRNTHLMRAYGITVAQYEALLVAQGGACAICGGRRGYKLAVDHDHKTGRVRGLLCKLCNGRILPAARDRVDVLQAAVEYLLSPPAIAVLGVVVVPGAIDGEG
jgi:DNA-directed RNA polymerase subunit RPC12/RpoP